MLISIKVFIEYVPHYIMESSVAMRSGQRYRGLRGKQYSSQRMLQPGGIKSADLVEFVAEWTLM